MNLTLSLFLIIRELSGLLPRLGSLSRKISIRLVISSCCSIYLRCLERQLSLVIIIKGGILNLLLCVLWLLLSSVSLFSFGGFHDIFVGVFVWWLRVIHIWSSVGCVFGVMGLPSGLVPSSSPFVIVIVREFINRVWMRRLNIILCGHSGIISSLSSSFLSRSSFLLSLISVFVRFTLIHTILISIIRISHLIKRLIIIIICIVLFFIVCVLYGF